MKKNKIYRDEHKHISNEKNKCDCGGCYTRINKSVHERTKKHQAFILLSLSVAKNCDEVRSSSGQSSENSEAVK